MKYSMRSPCSVTNPINLSILDFKCSIAFPLDVDDLTINLSILDFKYDKTL